MALRVENLKLTNWRSIERLGDGRGIDLDPSLTMLVGPNATGKTNTMEALALLTRGVSFRHARAVDQVRQVDGAPMPFGRAEARIGGDGRRIDVAVTVGEEGRRFTWNGKPVAPGSVAGTLLSVVFTPDDLTLVKSTGRARRQEIDGYGAQASRGFGKIVRAYQRSVEQRNRLLKEAQSSVPDDHLLDAWDRSVAVGAATLLRHRLSLLGKLAPLWEEAYAAIADGERLAVGYQSSLDGFTGPLTDSPGRFGTYVDAIDGANVATIAVASSRDVLADLFVQSLRRHRQEELRRGVTVIGPHRDDILLEVGGRDARTFASQGQQRSIVLALKLAQVRFSEEYLGERPILLLDDVMSELDDARRAAIAHLVDEGIQTVITTTHLGYFDEATLARAKVVPYGPGADGGASHGPDGLADGDVPTRAEEAGSPTTDAPNGRPTSVSVSAGDPELAVEAVGEGRDASGRAEGMDPLAPAALEGGAIPDSADEDGADAVVGGESNAVGARGGEA